MTLSAMSWYYNRIQRGDIVNEGKKGTEGDDQQDHDTGRYDPVYCSITVSHEFSNILSYVQPGPV